MSSTEYEPRGLPRQAIQHLRCQPRGTRITGVMLAEAIDVRPQQLSAILEVPLRAGLLRREPDPDDGRRSVWSLGDGTPLERTADEPLAPEPPPPVPEPTAAGKPTPSHGAKPSFTWPETVAAPSPPRAPAAHPPAAAGADALRLALWSDGNLEARRGGELVALFTAGEVRQLLHYLDCMAAEVPRA